MKITPRFVFQSSPSFIGALLLISFMASCEEPAATSPTGQDSTSAEDSIARWDSTVIAQIPMYRQSVVAIHSNGDTLTFVNREVAAAKWYRTTRNLFITSYLGLEFYLPDVSSTGTFNLTQDSLDRHVVLRYGGKYVSNFGHIRITEFDPQFHKLSATFEFTLVSRWTEAKDTIHVRGVYHSISLHTNEDLALAKILFEDRQFTPGLRTSDSGAIRLYGEINSSTPGCRNTPDWVKESITMSIKGEPLGLHRTSDGSEWAYTYDIAASHPWCPERNGYGYRSQATDTLMITDYDRDHRTISGWFTIGQRRGSFQRLSWLR